MRGLWRGADEHLRRCGGPPGGRTPPAPGPTSSADRPPSCGRAPSPSCTATARAAWHAAPAPHAAPPPAAAPPPDLQQRPRGDAEPRTTGRTARGRCKTQTGERSKPAQCHKAVVQTGGNRGNGAEGCSRRVFTL